MTTGLEALLLDQVSEMLLAVDPATLEIVHVNQRTCEMLGYEKSTLKGRSITELETALADIFYWEDVRQGGRGEINGVEGLYACADGSLLPVNKTVKRIDLDGRPLLCLMLRDERDLKQTETHLAELTAQLQATLESIWEGIVVTNIEGQIAHMNRRFAAMWEMPESLLLEDSAAIQHWLKQHVIKTTGEPALLQPGASSCDVIEVINGKVFEQRSRPQTMQDQVIGHVFSFHDITARIVSEREMMLARERAEAANKAKSRFLATMSHEIRTPMNGILGMAQMLLLPDLKETERLDYARTVFNSGQTLLTLLNDILDLSKVEAGKLKLEATPFELAPLLQECKALFIDLARQKGLQLTAHCDGTTPCYIGDPHRLRQMLANLVGNAIKFTAQGSVRIDVCVQSQDERAALLEFSVTDTGIGIPAEKLGVLFRPFSQADDSTTRQFGGTGLGLSIVSSLARQMGGDVGVDSTPGQGSRFWFRVLLQLPSVESAQLTDRETEDAAAASNRALHGRILVVEDNLTNQRVIRALLESRGLTCLIANDGQQGLEALQADPTIDAVLMDIQMPVMDGYEATRTLRRLEQENTTRRRPVIALSADAYEEDRQRCLAEGMDDFLAKPVIAEALFATLSRWLPASKQSSQATVPPKAVTSDELPVFEISTLLDPLEGSTEIAGIVVASSLHELPNYLDQLVSHVANQDWKAAGRLTHSLKGIGAQLGGKRFAQLATQLDNQLRAGQRITPADVIRLNAEHDALVIALREWAAGAGISLAV